MTPSQIPQLAPIAMLFPSPTNPRTRFEVEDLATLSESITAHGVLQPLLCRPLPGGEAGTLEIVCGERRYRSARMAALAEIPVLVRELSDEDVLRIQLIENLQRVDLSPLEEAEGYARLQGIGMTPEQIGQSIGKSRSYVYGQIKLLNLGDAGRAALADGTIDASRALLLARIPLKHLQDKALADITEGYDGPLSYRKAAQLIQSRYMLRLAAARFPTADESLVATCGACHACAKRTGNQTALFPDVDDADVCTDPDCFEAKNKAFADRVLTQAKAREQKVIEGDAAKKIRPSEYSSMRGDYVELDKQLYGEHQGKTLRDLAGDDAPAPALLVDPADSTHLIEIVPRATIAEHLKAKGVKLPYELTEPAKASKASQREKEQAKKANDFRARLFDAIRSHLTQHAYDPFLGITQRPAMLIVARAAFEHIGQDSRSRLAQLWIGPREKGQDAHEITRALDERIESLDAEDLMRLALECSAVGDLAVPGYCADHEPKKMLALATLCGIDVEAIKHPELAEAKKAKTKAKPAAKKPSPPSTAARAGGSSREKAARAAGSKPAVRGKDRAPAKPAKKQRTSSADEKPARSSQFAIEIKYRNPDDDGQTWTGRGKKPLWVSAWLAKGGTLEEIEAKADRAPGKPAEENEETLAEAEA